ncbi:MAG: GC-type dockerin domain-anchored protein [Planctomycetota bacterium]
MSAVAETDVRLVGFVNASQGFGSGGASVVAGSNVLASAANEFLEVDVRVPQGTVLAFSVTNDAFFCVTDPQCTGAPESLGGEVMLSVSTICLPDVNGDGVVSQNDFAAWILAFNDGLSECDQNGDGLCTSNDFNAFLLNLNRGC